MVNMVNLKKGRSTFQSVQRIPHTRVDFVCISFRWNYWNVLNLERI